MDSVPSMQISESRQDLLSVTTNSYLTKLAIFLKKFIDGTPRNILQVDI
uniref:ATP binding protein n=1 Tax=Rhizophora mucronata TaxID=61149 RepID=A0A2P2LK71_RHIMU